MLHIFYSRGQRIFFVGIVVAFLIQGLLFSAQAQTNCTPVHTSGTSISNGYAAAYDLFGSAKELLMKVSCSGSDAQVTIGKNTYDQNINVYKNGYYSNGGAWQPITFTGTLSGESWIASSASTNLSSTAGTHYFLAYICQYVNNEWKCGCSNTACTGSSAKQWSIQSYTATAGDSSSSSSSSTGGSSTSSTGSSSSSSTSSTSSTGGSSSSSSGAGAGASISYVARTDANAANNGAYSMLTTGGYSALGDGGGAKYYRDPSNTSSSDGHRGGFRDAGGHWWELDEPFINVKMLGAKGNGTSFDDSAINAAVQAAKEKFRGGKVYLPAGDYLVRNPIILEPGSYLVGDGASTNAGTRGTVIRAGANMSAIVRTSLTIPAQPITIENLSINGNSDNGFSVGVGLHLFGRSMRVLNVKVSLVSGTGIHLLRTDFSTNPPKFAWVNYIANTDVSKCGIGIYNETSDGYFYANYFTNNDYNIQKTSGGNVWMGNHFDHAIVGLKMIYDPRWTTAGQARISDRLIGNYFDLNDTALQITDEGHSNVPESNFVIDGNIFRANKTSIHIEGVNRVSVSDSQFITGGTTQNGIVWSNATGGMMRGLQFSPNFPQVFVNKPSDVIVSDLLI